MKRWLLLYASQTGFTQRYAQWIGQALGVEPIPLAACRLADVAAADGVIFGGSLRGSLLTGQPKVARLCRRAGNKPVVWFAVGIRPATDRTLDLVRRNNFSREERPQLFYFRGGMATEKLKPGDKTLLLCYRAMMRRRRDLPEEDEALLPLLRQDCDFTSRDQIAPLLQTVAREDWAPAGVAPAAWERGERVPCLIKEGGKL